jgi:hypothetical protein
LQAEEATPAKTKKAKKTKKVVDKEKEKDVDPNESSEYLAEEGRVKLTYELKLNIKRFDQYFRMNDMDKAEALLHEV